MKKQEKKAKGKVKKKLRILAAGDIHGDASTVKKLAEKASKEKVDLVILSGDIISPIETKNIIKPFKKAGKRVLLIPGNWESIADVDFLAEMYDIKNIHGYSTKYKGIGIFGAGGITGGGEDEKEIFQTLKKGNSRLKDVGKKIMVTHMHASGTKSELSGFPGSKGIRKAIQLFKPNIFISSHIHEASGLEEKIGKTRIISVGKKGKIIEI